MVRFYKCINDLISVELRLTSLSAIKSSSGFSGVTRNISELLTSKDALENRLKDSGAEWPFCVFYRDPSKYQIKRFLFFVFFFSILNSLQD